MALDDFIRRIPKDRNLFASGEHRTKQGIICLCWHTLAGIAMTFVKLNLSFLWVMAGWITACEWDIKTKCLLKLRKWTLIWTVISVNFSNTLSSNKRTCVVAIPSASGRELGTAKVPCD